MAYVVLPIITMCSSNTYSMEEESPATVTVNNNDVLEVQEVLGMGHTITITNNDLGLPPGTFIAHFAPKPDKNGIITVNFYDSKGEQKVLVENGKFYLLQQDGQKEEYLEEFQYGGILKHGPVKYGIIEYRPVVEYKRQTPNGIKWKHIPYKRYKTKYYLAATYAGDLGAGDDLKSNHSLVDFWDLLDNEYYRYNVGYLKDTHLIGNFERLRNNIKERSLDNKARYNDARTESLRLGFKIKVGTMYYAKDKVDVNMNRDSDFLRQLSAAWKNTKDEQKSGEYSAKYIAQLKNFYHNLDNYFGDTSQEAFEELLNDIYEYYQLRDKDKESKH